MARPVVLPEEERRFLAAGRCRLGHDDWVPFPSGQGRLCGTCQRRRTPDEVSLGEGSDVPVPSTEEIVAAFKEGVDEAAAELRRKMNAFEREQVQPEVDRYLAMQRRRR